MGISKRGGHSLNAIYLILGEVSINFFFKHTRSVANKLTEIKKPPENLFISPVRHKTSEVIRNVNNFAVLASMGFTSKINICNERYR